MANHIKVTRALEGPTISGKMAVVAPQGALVNIKASTVAGKPGVFDDATELELTTARRAFVLERDVLAGPDIPLDKLIFQNDILSPEVVGNYVSARQVQEIEVEGAGLIDIGTATRLLSGATPIDSRLTTLAGKWALITDATIQELAGILRGQLAVEDAANTFRLLIEVMP